MRRLEWVLLVSLSAQAGEEDLEARVRILEQRWSSRGIVELMQQLDQLQQEIKSLRGQMEEIQHLGEDLERRIAEVENRLGRLEQAASPPPAAPQKEVTPEAGVPPAQPAPEAEQTAPDLPQDPKQAYQKAYETLQAGLYEEAIAAFSAFLKAYPQAEQAADAWYWLGEAYYVKRDFIGARNAFQQVIERFPDHPKASDAWLKLGYVTIDMGDWQSASRYLNEVTRRFPGTRAAQSASERLTQMQGENSQ